LHTLHRHRSFFKFFFQFVAYVVAATFATESFYDLVGTSTYLASALYTASLGALNLQQKVLTVMISLWATRLGIFLVHRFHQSGRDKRFDRVKGDPPLFFVYW
jgi:steroid 5-alpha reductase family enzyme